MEKQTGLTIKSLGHRVVTAKECFDLALDTAYCTLHVNLCTCNSSILIVLSEIVAY